MIDLVHRLPSLTRLLKNGAVAPSEARVSESTHAPTVDTALRSTDSPWGPALYDLTEF
jgi:hypothetical protein